jgi:hypothetical protein
MEITSVKACKSNWLYKSSTFTHTMLRQVSRWLFEASNSVFYRFTNRPWAKVFKLSEEVLNWSRKYVGSILESKERLCKSLIEGIDKEKCWLDEEAESEAWVKKWVFDWSVEAENYSELI